MKTDRFVSVIAPLFNDEDVVENFIRETILILRENYTNYELVLVDDDSRDQTVERVSRLLSDYEGIRLIRLSRAIRDRTNAGSLWWGPIARAIRRIGMRWCSRMPL